MSSLSTLTNRPGLRWLVPAGAAVAVLGGGLAIGAITAAADPSLPTRSAAELLTDLQTAKLDGLSGTVVARADLGLPAIPVGGNSAELGSLVSGTHTLRVWYSGPDQVRVALLGTLGETDVITNGTDVWVWSSKENKASHSTLPAKPAEPTPLPSESPFAMTPDALAKAALAMLGPSTEVTTDGSASVAGRDAYELKLAPRDPASLIGSIKLDIDAVEHVPLRVVIEARGGGSPAIDVGFTQVSFARPDPSEFTFNPPPGATVEEAQPGSHEESAPGSATPSAPSAPAAPSADGNRNFAVVGSGWTSVIVTRLPKPAEGADNPAAGLLAALPSVSGPWGSGKLVSSRLFSALITDDGRVLIGAVSPDRLTQAAADPKATLGS
jgi:outer membrane lipoprotein-sorting protein